MSLIAARYDYVHILITYCSDIVTCRAFFLYNQIYDFYLIINSNAPLSYNLI